MNRFVAFGLFFAISGAHLAWAQEAPDFGDAIIDFALKTTTGESIDVKEFRKDKVLVLKFSTSLCPRCVLLIREIKKVESKYDPKKVAVLEVDIQEDAKAVAAHMKKYKISHPVVLDSEGKVATQYGIHYLPVVLVVDREGTVVYRGDGLSAPTTAKEIMDLVDAACE